MAQQITICQTAWKLFKVALEDAIEKTGDDEPFVAIREMAKVIESEGMKAAEVNVGA